MGRDLKRILFIDDDPDIHFIVQLSLESLTGVKLDSALSGEEGIKSALQFKPDLILLDVMMPKMDGIETLKALKLMPNLASIPVVFLTARAQRSDLEDYHNSGALDVIVKPFDPLTLPDIVLQIWNQYLDKA